MTTILVVEDEAVVAADIVQHLKRSGYVVPATAATGEAALHLAEALLPDLILMDILLKGEKDGIETAGEIQDRFEIPIIFLTGQTDETTLNRLRKTSQHGFLLKPIDAASLFPSIEMALTRHALLMELKESENRFRAVTDSAVEAIFSMDLKGTVIYWNKAAERVFGWKAAEIIGQSVTAILPESVRPGFTRMLHAIRVHGTYVPTSSMQLIRKDGTMFPAEPSFASWKTKEGTFATAIVRDISEQKAIIESMQAGVLLIDLDTHVIVDVNTAAAHLIGAPKEAIIGSGCQRFVCPAAAGQCPISDLGQTVDSSERVLLTADGKNRPILKSVSIIALRGRDYLLENFIDISDRKQMELALQEGEAYYRAIFESAATGMAIIEDDMTVAMANTKLEQLTGFNKQEVEGLKKWTEFVAPEDLDRLKWYHRARRTLEGSAPKDYEFRLLTKDGTQRAAFLTVALIPGSQRSVISIVDITAQKKAQEAVQKQATMLDAAHDCIMTLDQEGTITYWNRGAERRYGWTKREVLGQNANALLTTTFPESREALWSKLMERGLWEGELIHVTRDGVPVTVTSSWTLLKDEKGNASAIFEISSDITERKKAELALAESEATLRTTFATMADGVIIVGLDGTVTDCNNAILRLTERSREEIIGNPLEGFLAPEFRSVILEARKFLVGAILTKQTSGLDQKATIRTDSQVLRKNGLSVDIEANVTLIEDATRRPAAFLIVARDVTERKRMEQQLDHMLADLKRSNAELEQFAYIASHDLQEPLRMITSYIQIISEDYKGKLDPEADEYIEFIVDGAKRMQTLINDLLKYSRVGTRREPLEPISTEIILSEAISNLEMAIDESHAIITHDKLPVVLGDEPQLVQLFQNVLSNAIKFKSDEAPAIHVGVQETRDDWVFSVHDNGIGIDMKYAERIFTVFQRLHTRSEYPGTGIGLAVVKKIVERHDGRIWVESAPGKGSTFYFTLPKKEG
ncbi:MAG: PAS domain S-box protein [Halobacteriota archaeon]